MAVKIQRLQGCDIRRVFWCYVIIKPVFGIFQHTLRNVSHCPNISEYATRASDNCAKVCERYIKDRACEYHCMRDSSKRSLVEFCAKSKILFDYCPVYDLRGQRIQKDFDAFCKKSKSFQRHYNSSDIFFCDPENCLKLHDPGVSNVLTALVTETTPINSRDIHDTRSSLHWYTVFISVLVVVAVVVLACISCKRLNISAWFREIISRRLSNGSEDRKETRILFNVEAK